MSIVSRRDFIRGATALFLSGLITVSDPLSLASPQEEEPGYQFLRPPQCDFIIRNGLIIDGTGERAFRGSVGVKGDQIVAVGRFPEDRFATKIDGEGLVITPGFIDIHTHTENYIHSGTNPSMILHQGVTTQMGGNCGSSPFSTGDYFSTLGALGVNVGLFAGYRSIRHVIMGGNVARYAHPREVALMQRKLEEHLQAGAFGLSIGLEYYPQTLARTEEIIELCQVIKEYNSLYVTHLRSEGDKLLESLDEALTIGQKAGVAIQYSHIKASFERNWHKFPRVLETLTEAKAAGIDITGDTYCYTFSSWDIGTNPLRHSISRDNLWQAMNHSQVMFSSDSGLRENGGASHPRAYGNYPRFIREVLDNDLMPLEKAIYKMTGFPSTRLGLGNRGFIKPGMKADILAFEPKEVTDVATYNNPTQLSQGIKEVWLNGQRVIDEGIFTGLMAGEKLLHT